MTQMRRMLMKTRSPATTTTRCGPAGSAGSVDSPDDPARGMCELSAQHDGEPDPVGEAGTGPVQQLDDDDRRRRVAAVACLQGTDEPSAAHAVLRASRSLPPPEAQGIVRQLAHAPPQRAR